MQTHSTSNNYYPTISTSNHSLNSPLAILYRNPRKPFDRNLIKHTLKTAHYTFHSPRQILLTHIMHHLSNIYDCGVIIHTYLYTVKICPLFSGTKSSNLPYRQPKSHVHINSSAFELVNYAIFKERSDKPFSRHSHNIQTEPISRYVLFKS